MRIEGLEGSFGPNIAVQFLPEVSRWAQAEVAEAMTSNYLQDGDTSTGSQASGSINATTRRAPVKRTAKAKAPRRASEIMDAELPAIIQQLRIGKNKLRILRMLKRRDWIHLLYLMPKNLLINALRLFPKEKLLQLIMLLPKQLLIKLLLKIFRLEELIKKMPTKELLNILRSKRLRNRELSKGILALEPKYILMLLQSLYGSHDYSKLKPYDMHRIFMHTKKERLMEAFKHLPFKALQPLVTGFVKEDPELLMRMSDLFIFKLLDRVTKPSLMEGAKVLPEEMLIRMLTQLPDQFLMLAAAQIDDQMLEKYLMQQHPDLLKLLAGAA